MGKHKDLKGQIVMARRLGQSISKTAALVGCSRSAVVSIYQKWSKEGTVVNRRQGHGRPRFIDARGERRLARVVRSNRRTTVAQIAQEVNAGSDRKVSEYTVHHSLLRMGLHSRRPVRVPMLTCASLTWGTHGTRMHYGKRQAGGGSVMLWAMFCWETLGPKPNPEQMTVMSSTRNAHKRLHNRRLATCSEKVAGGVNGALGSMVTLHTCFSKKYATASYSANETNASYREIGCHCSCRNIVDINPIKIDVKTAYI
ncbi:hypothetical protein DPX16_6961 [Anabarilius grahami]|uniref:Transposase Tc1-like domain-containing protein n=1 Tax=Anabarilius grahami TaxID=495550 RepID=A0A3N0Y5S4_ANAGA|nr:hypothetical protein DPX16_6961 [Anabarilius grahami]